LVRNDKKARGETGAGLTACLKIPAANFGQHSHANHRPSLRKRAHGAGPSLSTPSLLGIHNGDEPKIELSKNYCRLEIKDCQTEGCLHLFLFSHHQLNHHQYYIII
jgi:hypothetical protein